MAQKLRYPLIVIASAVLIAAVFLIGRVTRPESANAAPAAAAPRAATPTAAPATRRFSGFYLDVGGSASLGAQPTGILGHNGSGTTTGYANDIVLRERLSGVSLGLEEVGCPGDTVQSVLDTTQADACYLPPQTQLTKSVAYLEAQTGPGLVTVDLGFNDVRTCLEADPVNQVCLAAGIHAIQVDLPKILDQLKSAAPANVRFIGIEYFDPYLAYYFKGAGGPARAAATLEGVDRVNAVFGQIFARAGFKIANVPAFFQMANSATETLDNVGTIPINVQQVCELSWMCDSAPFGPDDHPNNAGYSLIAAAIEAVLPTSW